MNNKHYKIAIFALLTFVVGTFTHCVQNSPIGGSSTSGSSRSPGSTPVVAPTPEQVLNQAQVEVGLKNFEQINYTFAELTGVPVSNGSVSGTYRDVEPTLPGENEVKVLSSSNQVAIVRLAAEYCNQLINTGNFVQSRDNIIGNVVLTQLPSAVDEQLLANRITNAFWGQGVIDPVELDAARLELMDVFNDVVAMETVNQNSTGTTNKAVRAVCTSALSSAYVTIM